MSHPSAEQVAEYLEGVLSTDDHERVHAHLEHCAQCAALAGNLAAVPEALRAVAAAVPAIPEQVEARVRSAIADEAGRRSPAVQAGSLSGRRHRRRRALAGGLLAAAAATVVAVGLGELVRTGGPGDGSAGGSAGESAVTGPAPAAGPSPDGSTAERGPGIAAAPQAPGERAQGPRLSARGLSEAELIAAVAARHIPGTVRRDRPACIDAALGPAARTAAAYAVRLPAGSGGSRAVVVLRPGVAPTEGVLVACDPSPRVLLRRGLSE